MTTSAERPRAGTLGNADVGTATRASAGRAGAGRGRQLRVPARGACGARERGPPLRGADRRDGARCAGPSGSGRALRGSTAPGVHRARLSPARSGRAGRARADVGETGTRGDSRARAERRRLGEGPGGGDGGGRGAVPREAVGRGPAARAVGGLLEGACRWWARSWSSRITRTRHGCSRARSAPTG